MSTEIKLLDQVGVFAENKDTAKNLRIEIIIPALERGEDVTLNFQGVEGATQSFIHALISDLFRKMGSGIFEKISFKNCNPTVQRIISIVVDYMQESF
jgi:hypothetical protein